MLVKTEDFHSFLHRIAYENLGGYSEVYTPARSDDTRSHFASVRDGEKLNLEGHRLPDPVRMFFYQPREQVYPVNTGDRKVLIAGVKACDVRGLQVLDTALLEQDFVDPAYQKLREQITLISSDCTTAAPTCHCTLVDGTPYLERGYDLNISRIDERYLMTIGSTNGEELANLIRKHIPVEESSSFHHDVVSENRRKMTSRVKDQNQEYSQRQSYGNLSGQSESAWQEESRKCVGCGGCTNICPTCHCMILNDESSGKDFVKVREFDSCQLHGYARVAGGGSPRPRMNQRFRHRYLCKFQYMPANFDQLGCTGCGRCIDVCPGGIEFRAVTTRLTGSQIGGDVGSGRISANEEV